MANLPPATTVHILAIDRPGMGLSTFEASRRILDWPLDVLALVDYLKIEKFYALGDSGGSPYALMCARDIPRTRLLGVAVVLGIHSLSLGTRGMMFGVKALLYAGLYLPQGLMMKVLDWEFGNIARGPDKGKFEEIFMKAMEKRDERDKRCLDDLVFRHLVIESMRECFREGSKGAAPDRAPYGDRGFELEKVSGENVVLWHGKKGFKSPVHHLGIKL